MNAVVQNEQGKNNPVVRFKQQFDERRAEFAGALPAHIPFERYARVIQTAVAQNSELLYADRASLFTAAMKSATDGLLCDGREAALVIFKAKKKDDEGNDRWTSLVQYMPMVAGILKKVRNSGELAAIVARVVYAGDKFRNWIDDSGEHIEYEASDEQDRSVVRRVFAMAKLKDGSIEVEVLTPADIEKIRSVSRAKDKGPWVDWWEEMAKKSAIRRLSKRLPVNTDLDDLVRHDDALYDLDGASDRQQRINRPALTVDQKLDLLAGEPAVVADPQTGEIDQATNTTSRAKAPTAAQEADAGGLERSGDGGAGPQAEAASRGDPAPSQTEGSGTAAADRAAATASAQTSVATARQADPEKSSPAPAKREPKKGDDPARDEATLIDLRQEGERRANEGPDALAEFEANLTDYENELIAPSIGGLRRKAKAVAKGGAA